MRARIAYINYTKKLRIFNILSFLCVVYMQTWRWRENLPFSNPKSNFFFTFLSCCFYVPTKCHEHIRVIYNRKNNLLIFAHQVVRSPARAESHQEGTVPNVGMSLLKYKCTTFITWPQITYSDWLIAFLTKLLRIRTKLVRKILNLPVVDLYCGVI